MKIIYIKYNGIEHSITKCFDSNQAKKVAKNSFDKTCIFTNIQGGVIGAHIFSAGIYPELKCYPINIVSILPDRHCGKNNTLDIRNDGTERLFDERIEYILDNCHPDWLGKVRNRIELLNLLALDLGCNRGGFVK